MSQILRTKLDAMNLISTVTNNNYWLQNHVPCNVTVAAIFPHLAKLVYD